MNDAQDKSLQEDPEVNEEVMMDEVVESRPIVKKKSGFLGFLIVLLLLVAAGGAGWYYQSMWLPQVQDGAQQAQLKIQQAKAWLDDALSFGKKSEQVIVAEPKVMPAEVTTENNKPNYVVAAISEPKSVAEEKVKEDNKALENKAVVAEPVLEVIETETVTATQEASETPAAPEVSETDEVVAMVEAVIEEPVVTKEEKVVPENVTPQIVENITSITVTETPAMKLLAEIKRPAVDLADARQAFWQRDLPKAEALYKEQIKNSQVNADSWGELGNIYYFQAKWQLAATAYTEASLILLDKGVYPQAMFLRYIVMGLDPVQGKRIDERLQALQAPL